MTILESHIAKIRNQFSSERLREMFVGRTHDELFKVTALAENGGKSTNIEPHLLVWRGYELLLGLK